MILLSCNFIYVLTKRVVTLKIRIVSYQNTLATASILSLHFSGHVGQYFTNLFIKIGFQLIYICFCITNFSVTIFSRLLIQFTSSSEYTWRGYFYTTLLLVVALIQSLLLHQYFHCTFLLGMRIRSTIIAVVYRKVNFLWLFLIFVCYAFNIGYSFNYLNVGQLFLIACFQILLIAG